MEEPRAAELVGVGDPEVALPALQAGVRAAARARRGGRPPDVRRQPGHRRTHVLEDTAEIAPHVALQASMPVGGAVLVSAQRAIRRGLRWYLWPFTTRVSTHNRAIAEVVETHRRELNRMRVDVEIIDRDCRLLQRPE